MLQVPNIIHRPLILIPPTVAGALLAPIGMTIWPMMNNTAGAEMGTPGLVGQIMTFSIMSFEASVFLRVFLLHFVGPLVISLLISEAMRRKGWVKPGQMTISTGGK